MIEEKKENEIKEEEVVEANTDSAISPEFSENAQTALSSFSDDEDYKTGNEGELEELPDDVKKKLEKSKEDKQGKTRKKKKKIQKKVTVGKAFVQATYNNTIVTLTDLNGNVISWASAGIAGFKGPKKSTPYAAQIITRIAVEKARETGLKEVSVFVKGVGTGRESAVRALNANGLVVTYIKDITPVPHNGCRPKKPRRV
jgi:small subunit ribosomal protein S11